MEGKKKDALKVLHFFDDDKFIDPAIKLFESVIPGCSDYYVIAQKEESFKYVKSKIVTPLYLDDKDYISGLVKDRKNKIIFFHALNKSKQDLVHQFNSKVVKVWFIWGFDLYNNWKILKKGLLEKQTKILNKQNDWRQLLKNSLFFNKHVFNFCYLLRNKLFWLPKPVSNFINNNYFNFFYKTIQKIDIVVPVIPDEYLLVKAMKINPKFAPFTYGCIEDMLQNNLTISLLNAKNFLIGNSSNPTNNHVDVFKKLSKLNLGKRKVYVPLSYGGTKKYTNEVISKGFYYFGDNFKPIIDFIPLEDYNKIISSCGVIIFNHVRQQGLGNIIPLGYQGAKLFLNSKSPVYRYFKKKGIFVFNFREIDQKSIDVLLTEKEFDINQQKFFELYSNESVKNKIKTLLKTVSLTLNERN